MILQINGAVKGIGLALLVLFFLVGVVKTSGSLTEVKRPEHALKLFIRFAIAKGVVTYGLDLMLALFDIAQGAMRTIMTASGVGSATKTTLPSEMVTAIEDCGFFESIPLWASSSYSQYMAVFSGSICTRLSRLYRSRLLPGSLRRTSVSAS